MSSATEEANAAANAAIKEKTGLTPGEFRLLEQNGLGQYGASALPMAKQLEANKTSQNAACANGGPGGNGTGAAGGPAGTGGVNSKLMSNYNCALGKWQAANPGSPVQWNIISGVRNSSTVSNSQHFTGDAIDLQASVNGKAFNNVGRSTLNTDSYQLYKSMASAMAECDPNMNWGGNFENGVPYDTMHFGMGQKTTVNGNLFQGRLDPRDPVQGFSKTYKGSNDPATANANLTGENATAAQQAAGQQPGQAGAAAAPGAAGAAACGNSGGCAPINSAAAPVAASMAQGAGMASPLAAVTNALSGTALGGLQQGLQSAIGGAMGGLGNLSGALGAASSLAGLANPASMLSSVAGGALQQIGNFSQIGSMLTGVMGPMANLQGMAGTMLGQIQGNIGSVFGNLGSLGNIGGLAAGLGGFGNLTGMIGKTIPNLGNFSNMLGSMMSAGGMAGNIQGIMQNAGGQLFGNAIGLAGNLSNMAGFNIGNMTNSLFGNLPSNILNGMGGQDLDMLAGGFLRSQFTRSLGNTIDLAGNFADTMSRLTTGSKINGFGSLFYDYNGYVTNGFGTLTDNLSNLGKDLMNLGRLGDMNDLLNIGTPGQVARQIVEHGLGAATGISMMMREYGLDSRSYFRDEHHSTFQEILSKVNDPDIIANVKDKLLISDYINIEHLGDLTDHAKMFPYSYNDNAFEEIRDMAPLLSIVGTCRANTFEELGRVLATLEDVSDATDLLDETNFLQPEELTNLKTKLPPAGYFNPTTVTIADFIGTAAGYVHSSTLPRITEIYDILHTDYNTIIGDLQTLMALLTDTLNGDYLVTGTPDRIVVPNTVGYTFGTYYALDDAAADIQAAIEEEIALIEEAVEADADLQDLMNELTGHWNDSHDFLVHEKKMRKAYGVDFGNPEETDHFSGDGSTLSFPLTAQATGTSKFSVYINGVKQFANNFSYNSSTNSIEFTTAPSSLSTISIEYQTNALKIEGGINDIWSLATSIDQMALSTGYGMPADFLNRILTDDMHGQRIRAVMAKARNDFKLQSRGCSPLNFTTVTEELPDPEIDYIDHTGIWSNDLSRAAEIYLQNKTDKNDPYNYALERLSANKQDVDSDVETLLQNITRQLIFFYDGSLVVSDLFASIYESENEASIRDEYSRNDLIIPYNDTVPYDGYVLGPYTEVLSKIMEIENLKNTTFVQQISAETEKYHQDMGIDLTQVVRILQRILNVNGAALLGINEGDFGSIFGTKSASKIILQNIAYDY